MAAQHHRAARAPVGRGVSRRLRRSGYITDAGSCRSRIAARNGGASSAVQHPFAYRAPRTSSPPVARPRIDVVVGVERPGQFVERVVERTAVESSGQCRTTRSSPTLADADHGCRSARAMAATAKMARVSHGDARTPPPPWHRLAVHGRCAAAKAPPPSRPRGRRGPQHAGLAVGGGRRPRTPVARAASTSRPQSMARQSRAATALVSATPIERQSRDAGIRVWPRDREGRERLKSPVAGALRSRPARSQACGSGGGQLDRARSAR